MNHQPKGIHMKLYLAERTDEHRNRCWGQNTSLVCAAEDPLVASDLANAHLRKDFESGNIHETLTDDGKTRPLELSDLRVTYIGEAKEGAPAGVIIVSGPGN